MNLRLITIQLSCLCCCLWHKRLQEKLHDLWLHYFFIFEKKILVTLFLSKKINKPLFLRSTQLVINTKSCFKTCLWHQNIALNVVLDGTLLAL